MKTKPVAGYYRVSVARDGMKAPELYEAEIRNYSRYKGLELGEVFSDLDYSGYRNSEKRPALNELVARRHEFSQVIVPKLSRFGRSLKHLTQLFDTFDSDGIALIFLDLGLDTSTSQGRLLRNVMAAFAEYESDVRSDYARANHRRVRAEGRPWGGRPPFGYRLHSTERSYVVDDDAAAVIREVFASYLAGKSQYGIASELNRLNQRRPSGAPWSAQQIGRVLDNPAYAALCVVDDEFLPATWQAIIDRETWGKVRKVRADQAARVKQLRVRKPGPFLLSGLIYCGGCGRKMHHRAKAKTSDGIYCCVLQGSGLCSGGSVDARLAEDYVTQRFLERRADPDPNAPTALLSLEREWERASIVERRKLLWPAIARVVLQPWPDTVDPRRAGGRRRELRVEWTNQPRADQTPDAIHALGPAGASADHRRVSEGRPDMLREAEAAASAAAGQERSRRSRSASATWRAFREERLIDAGVPPAVGPPPAAATSPE